MSLAEWIRETLEERLRPESLAVIDESHQHEGHAGAAPGGETHFRLDVVSQAFEGKSRVERHRMVNALLDEAFRRGLHALALRARTPAEAAEAAASR
ncbi:BolA family protein [Methylobacterium sp. 4-46]|uniref:BolA family protein n=1 Tax=unclassified Methylobacterium TaxID=2615210 RepID=UPI000152C262|nr:MULTISPECIES: BolA family protein [Methylobacterium]ACA20752.1 BolA family protein [Methylobacterium sp. 4-46]WFT79903.1 BolA family transcriptional regulator [Methylobacterium nodulans]